MTRTTSRLHARAVRAAALGAIVALLAACAPRTAVRGAPGAPDTACRELLGRLDAEVDRAGVRNAATVPVPSFPYLRTNRFTAALGDRLDGAEAGRAWLAWTERLDREARRSEVANLPAAAVGALGARDAEELTGRVEACSAQLSRADREVGRVPEPGLRVPDEYSTALQVVGLYPLAVLPVAVATAHSRARVRSWYEVDLGELPVEGRLTAYAPAPGGRLTSEEVARVLRASRRNALDVPLPGPEDAARLVRTFAPVLVQDVVAPYDRIGEVVLGPDGATVRAERPTAYYYLSHAFRGAEPVLQLNYVVWYPARAGPHPPWFERGHLDGLTVRVWLDRNGTPFLADVVNNCGCYHVFAPADPSLTPPAEGWSSLAFVPQRLPTLTPTDRLGLRVLSGWHQVQRFLAVSEAVEDARYALVPYATLESLPRPEGGRESLFDEEGIARGSDRPERFLLFPMGIPRVGAMRQRGHHAIDFFQRVHFDDPDLLDRAFPSP